MKMPAFVIVGASLIAFAGIAKADDHLTQAQTKGLSPEGQAIGHTHAFTTNSALHSGDLAPGQGSPFTGADKQTPATDTEAANLNANVKPRAPK